MLAKFRNASIRNMLRLMFAHPRPIAETRAFTDRLSGLGAALPKGMQVENIEINGRPAAWIMAETALSKPVILYLHGGGYVSGSLLSHRMICFPLAEITPNADSVTRLSPCARKPFPCCIRRCVKRVSLALNARRSCQRYYFGG